jgi:hypothetical protein
MLFDICRASVGIIFLACRYTIKNIDGSLISFLRRSRPRFAHHFLIPAIVVASAKIN